MKADWSELPTELWSVIGYKIDIGADRIRFRSVCNAMRYSLPFPQPPWLLLSEPNEHQPDSDDSEDDNVFEEEDGDYLNYDCDFDFDDEDCANVVEEEENEDAGESRVVPTLYNHEEIKPNQPPIHSPRGFVGLGDQHAYELDLPEAHEKRFLGSTGTWLITVDTDDMIYMLNPFSRVQIKLPSQSTFPGYHYNPKPRYRRDFYMRKIVLSHSSTRDCVAMACFGKLAIARPGDASWTKVRTSSRDKAFEDAIFYKGRFYAVAQKGLVFVCDIGDDLRRPKASILMNRFQVPKHKHEDHKIYLVEWMGDLLMVIKTMNKKEVVKYSWMNSHIKYLEKLKRDEDSPPLYKTEGFKVYKLDFIMKKWDELKSLGEYSLFLGANSSVSVLPSDFSGRLKKNCIYFTDDYFAGYLAMGTPGGREMGVFDMESNTIKPHYKGISVSRYSPPIWLIPTPLPKSSYSSAEDNIGHSSEN